MILGLTGLKGTGKSTVARYLHEVHGFHEVAFADALYREVAAAFGVPVGLLRSRLWKTQVQPALALVRCNDPEFVRMLVADEMPNVGFNISPFCAEAQTCPRTSTFIVQRWATEYRRAQFGDDYWVNFVRNDVRKLPHGARIVVSDVRHDIEMALFDEHVAQHGPTKSGVIELVLPSAHHTGHSSDNGLSRHYVDRTIESIMGDHGGLFSQVNDFINKEMKWKPLNLSRQAA